MSTPIKPNPKQTNIRGIEWVRVAAYLFQQGFKIEGVK